MKVKETEYVKKEMYFAIIKYETNFQFSDILIFYHHIF